MTQETSKEPKPEAPRKRRLLLKILAVLAVVFILVVVFLPYLVPTGWIAAAAEKGLQSALGRTARLPEVSWGWLSGVTIHDVVVDEREEFGGGEFVRMKRLSLDVSLWQFLSSFGKNVTVKSIVIDSPQVLVVRTADGRFNFEALASLTPKEQEPVVLASMSPSSGTMEIAVNRVRITNGAVTYKDLGSGAVFKTSEIDATVDADFSSPRVKGSAQLSLTVAQPEKSATLALQATHFAIDRQPSPAAAETIEAEGTLRIEGVELAQVIAAAAPSLTGSFASGKASVDIAYKAGAGKVELSSTNGRVEALVLGPAAVEKGPVAIGDVTFAFDAQAQTAEAKQSLALRSLKVAAPFADVALSGSANRESDSTAVSLEGSGSADPALIPPALVDLGEDVEMSGRVPFTLAYAGDPLPREVSLSLDAAALDVTAAPLRKKSGTAAALAAKVLVNRDKGEAAVDSLVVTLSGGKASLNGVVDLESRAARWEGAVVLEGVNAADYLDLKEKVVVSGEIEHKGDFILAEAERSSEFAIDTAYRQFTLDLVSRPGKEVVLSGDAAVNSARATARDFVVSLGGQPLTVNAVIAEPLAKPAGNIVVRGSRIAGDDLEALLGALAAAAPEESAPAEPAEETAEEDDTEKRASRLAEIYMGNADINLDMQVGEVTYEDYTGRNLVVDAALVGGKVLLRKASMDIFAGRVSLDSVVSLSEATRPCRVNFVVSALQANEPAKKFLSKISYGLDFAGKFDLAFTAEGSLDGDSDRISRSFTGGGGFDVTDGVFSLSGLPEWTSLMLPGAQFTREVFSKLHGNLSLADGTLTSKSLITRKDYTIFIEGRADYTGDNEQVIGVIPAVTGTTIRLVTVTNGKLRAEPLAADLVSAGLAGLIKKSLESDDKAPQGEQPAPEQDPLKSALEQLLKDLQKKSD